LFIVLLSGCSPKFLNEKRVHNTLKVALPKIATLDPIYSDETNEILISSFLYRTLTELEEGYAKSGLASYELGDNAKSVTFTINEEALFNNGDPVTSADVKASLTRVVDPKLQSPGAMLLSDIKGYAEAKAGKNFSGIKIINEKVFKVSFVRSRSDFPLIVANPFFGIISKKSITKDRKLLAPTVSSGSFQIDSQDLNKEGTLKDAVKFLGTDEFEVNEVLFTFTKNEEEAVKLFNNKKVDVTSLAQSSDLPKASSKKGITPSIKTVFYGFNVRNTLLQNPNLRKAILLAINKKDILEKSYGNDGSISNSILPDNTFGFDYICPDKCEFSMEKAKDYLNKANVDLNTLVVPIDVDDSQVQRIISQEIKSNLAAIGIKSEIRETNFDGLLSKIANYETGLFRFGWIMDGASPAASLERLFDSQSQENVTGFADSATNEHIEVSLASDQKKLIENQIKFAQKAVADAAIILPIANLNIRFGVRNTITNFELDINGKLDVDKLSYV
jgi:ABC-type oligopeptide transport system substrate-binding subunit